MRSPRGKPTRDRPVQCERRPEERSAVYDKDTIMSRTSSAREAAPSCNNQGKSPLCRDAGSPSLGWEGHEWGSLVSALCVFACVRVHFPIRHYPYTSEGDPPDLCYILNCTLCRWACACALACEWPYSVCSLFVCLTIVKAGMFFLSLSFFFTVCVET